MPDTFAGAQLLDKIGDQSTPVCLFIIFLVYVQCSAYAFEVLRWGACDRFASNDSESNAPSDVSFFTKDYSINCNEKRFENVRTFAWVMLLIYPVGTPILYCTLYWRYRRTLHSLMDTERMLAKASSLHEYTGKAMRRSSWDPVKTTHSFGGDNVSEDSSRERKLSHWRRSQRRGSGSSPRGSARQSGSTRQEQGSTREGGSPALSSPRAEVRSATSDPLRFARDQSSSQGDAESRARTSTPQSPSSTTRAPARAFMLRTKSQNQLALEHLSSIKETSAGRLERMKDEMPSFMISLIGPYEFRCYWFEVFEVLQLAPHSVHSCPRRFTHTHVPLPLCLPFHSASARLA